MKKFLSLLLVVMMVVSLMPVQAFAETAQSSETTIVEPKKEQQPQPSIELEKEPTQQEEPVVEPVEEPTEEPAAEPAAEPEAEPVAEPEAEPQADGDSTLVTTGKAGENITWNYDETTKTLTFTGTGAMLDNEEYNFETVAPYFIYPVEKVVVGEGITELGTAMIYFGSDLDFEADTGNDTVTSVELPSTLTSIHASAFGGFNKLEKLVIPDSVTTIAEQIIEASPGIKELVLQDSISTIYAQTYLPLEGLERVIIPKNVTEIPMSTFSGCTKLAYIELPSGLTKIGYRSFYGITSLKEINIPESVTEIGDEAFGRWASDQVINIALTEEEAAEKMTFGKSWKGNATVNYGVKKGIKFNVTSNVENLAATIKWQNKDVVSVPYAMEEGADENCYFRVSAYASTNIGYRFKKLVLTIDGKSVTYNAGDATIKYDALVAAFGDSFVFSGSSTSVKNKSQISSSAFAIRGTAKTDVDVYIEFEELGNKVGDDITWSYDEVTKTLTFTGTGAMWDDSLMMAYATYPVEKVVIGEGITHVGRYKLYFLADAETKAHNTTLKEIVFPSTIKTLGNCSICGLDGIEVFAIPEGIETAEKQVFMSCDGIKEITFPSTMNSLGKIYTGLKNIERAVIPATITEIPIQALGSMEKLTYVELPEGLTTIGYRAFINDNALEEINIPSTVTKIDEGAFFGWQRSQVINFPMTEEEAAAKITFGTGWRGSATVRYKDDEDKFAGRTITWIDSPGLNLLQFIGEGEMYDYEGKTTPWHAIKESRLRFANNITTIGAYSMASFDDPSSYTTIDFSDNGNALKTIKDGAFKGLTGVTEIEIPASVTEIGSEVFAGWTAEQTIRFSMTEKEAKEAIKFADDWNKDCAAKIVYKQDTKWATGLTLSAVKDGKTYPMVVDLDKETVTVYGDEFKGSISLAGAAVTGELNGEAWKGTAVFSDDAAVEGADGKYTIKGSIVLTSEDEGNAVLTLKLAFKEMGFFSKTASIMLLSGSSIRDYFEYSEIAGKDKIVFTTNGAGVKYSAKIQFSVYDGSTVTADRGTVSMRGTTGVDITFDQFLIGDSVNVTIKNAAGIARTFEFSLAQGYQVRINDSVGGKFTALTESGKSVNSVAAGTVVMLKADPEPGMIVEEWVVEGVNNTPALTVMEGDPNTASFVMIPETVDVTAVFRSLKEGETDTGFRIKSVTVENGVAFVDEANSTVKIILDKGSDLTKVKPIIEVTPGATVSPASGEEVDLSRTIHYYYVSRNGGSHRYTFSASVNTMEKGRGTKDDPIRIENVDDLILFRDNVNAGTSYEGLYVVQTADLDLSQFGEAWLPIGTEQSGSGYGANPAKAFMGTYDGQNYKILNMKFSSDGADRAKALFCSTKNATIKNVVIDASCNIKASMYVAGVVGVASKTTFENCVNNANMYATAYATGSASDFRKSYAGGICGYADASCVFIKCRNTGSIGCKSDVSGWGYTGPDGTGGISGYGGTHIMCSNSGEISGGGSTGGVTGNGTAIGCWNTGKVEASYNRTVGNTVETVATGIGGVVGSGKAENCYNKGYVNGNWPGIGGVVGKGIVNNSYNTGAVTTTYDGDYAQAVGMLLGVIDGKDEMTNLFYVRMGEGNAIGYVGNRNINPEGSPISESDLRDSEVLEALMSYTSATLQKAEWMADLNGSNEGYPVIIDYSVSKSAEKKITSAKFGARLGTIDEENSTIDFTVNYGTDISSVALNLVISAGASVSPASGERVDFSKGAVTYTVTAADGSTRTYSVKITVPESGDGIADMHIGYYNYVEWNSMNSSLLGKGTFKQNQHEYTVEMNDRNLYENSGILAAFDIIAVPATRGAVITASVNGNDAVTLDNFSSANPNQYVAKDVSYADKIHPGKNTLVLNVTNPGSTDSVNYTINIILNVTIKEFAIGDATVAISPKFDPDVTEYTITLQDTMTELPVSYQASFKPERNMIKLTHPDGTIAYTKSTSSGNPIYEGNVKLTPEMAEFKIAVEATDDSTNNRTYTFKLNKIGTYEAELTSNVENAVIRVYDKDSNKLTPDENGKYVFTRGETYSYTATAKGYVSAAGTVNDPEELTDGKYIITLEKVPGVKYPNLSAYWPTFRGNDENMAITDRKTPTGFADTELVWAEQSGNGYGGGAVSSPIIVDGYIYAYAGKNIIKVDKETGKTVATGTMAGTSSFSIVPPTYADGMIFVGLAGGRVQAFRADTLESLWVYKDELGGQPNSRVVYKDGCVYTGFWNNETTDANFVCIDASDEDPSNPTEEKYALWTYTTKGGFYWAGAYATDKYIVVGTDDGDSGYKGYSKLLVFNKDTGEVVSSITDLVGDLRSDIAYDKASDRVYFTSKAGNFYSMSINWETGEINTASLKRIYLGGMSTSTPVVHNGRAYVGVSGTGQFVEYGGHNITVIDLNSWTVAYKAYTKGYPQTSGLVSSAYEGEDGYTYVYFTENYTPGAVRYIKDKVGVTGVIGGVMEKGNICASVIYIPGENLAQYCICSPVVDENGTIFFKNDTSYMMAIRVKAESLEIAEKPTSITENSDGTITAEDMKVFAVLKNGEKLDVSAYVTITKDGENAYTVTYTYGSEIAEGVKTLTASLTDDNRIAAKAVEDLIAAIGKIELTDECKAKIDAARAAYDKLTDAQKALISNYDVLTAAEAEYQKLLDQKKADEAAAKAVDDLIAAIGKVELTDECKAKIDAARAAYDKLTDAQKELVKNLKTLTDAEAEYQKLLDQKKADEAAAKAVDDLIAAIGKVELTDECKAKIDAARAAYDKLTDAQKELVKNLKTLTDAEEEYQKLLDRRKADEAAAKAVDEAVAKLTPVTLESGKAIEEARKAFDALTPEQKKLLDPETEGKLVAAENEYKKLVKEDADKKAAKEVEDKIAALQPVTKDSGEAIKDARSSYEALTPEQKYLVSKDVLKALEKAEKTYSMIVDSNKPDASDKGDKGDSSVIKITINGASKGEQNPNTGAPAMSIAPAMLVLAAAVLVLKKRG